MPNSPSQIIPEKFGNRAGQGRLVTVWRQSCDSLVVTPVSSIAMFKNSFWETLHEWQNMWLQDVMDKPLDCRGATDEY
ncbi:hypothetical protein TNCV_428651 [Trichonephila clavipes]|nr:hypothetical protein TNCV_428651 [Trichonephila clavipes]